MKSVACSVLALLLAANAASAKTVYARDTIPALGTPAGENDPECDRKNKANTDNIAKALENSGIEAAGKAAKAVVPGAGDPFNTIRADHAMCKSLCVIIPAGTEFTAKGSISPIDWQGDLPSGLPKSKDTKNYAGVMGPIVKTNRNGKLDTVCYVFKNWSHDKQRIVGVEVKY